MNMILYVNWDIDPVIFSLGSVKLQYYGLIFVTGLVLCYYIIGHIYKKENIYTPDAMEKRHCPKFCVNGNRIQL